MSSWSNGQWINEPDTNVRNGRWTEDPYIPAADRSCLLKGKLLFYPRIVIWTKNIFSNRKPWFGPSTLWQKFSFSVLSLPFPTPLLYVQRAIGVHGQAYWASFLQTELPIFCFGQLQMEIVWRKVLVLRKDPLSPLVACSFQSYLYIPGTNEPNSIKVLTYLIRL